MIRKCVNFNRLYNANIFPGSYHYCSRFKVRYSSNYTLEEDYNDDNDNDDDNDEIDIHKYKHGRGGNERKGNSYMNYISLITIIILIIIITKIV